MLDPLLQDREVISRIVRLFLNGRTVPDVNEELRRSHPGLEHGEFTTEHLHAVLVRAAELRMLIAPLDFELELAQQIRRKYVNVASRDIHVVNSAGFVDGRGKDDLGKLGDALSAVAADLVLGLLTDKMRTRPGEVTGLGLGPGRATLDFCKHLSDGLSRAEQPPKVNLFAITAGCLPRHPEYAPISFFNLFPANAVQERIGLFAENLIPAGEFGLMKGRPGVSVAFEEKHKVQIVVTAMGAMDDEHDILRQFFEEAGAPLDDLGAIGNVQYRPFSATGSIHEKSDQFRAVTLFELRELAELSRRPDHHVVLIARRCGRCGHNRAEAIRALLERKEEDIVFSSLILDSITAKAILSSPRS